MGLPLLWVGHGSYSTSDNKSAGKPHSGLAFQIYGWIFHNKGVAVINLDEKLFWVFVVSDCAVSTEQVSYV